MNEKIVVSQNIPHFLPDFNNPIFKLALDEEKRKLRREIVERIKCGTFENGIAPLFKTLNGFTKDEICEIISFWKDNRENLLLFWYFYPLENNDINKIEEADISYLIINTYIEKKENLGR